MAQKRMFDKRVVSSDKFIDLPHSSKALYFMAGMEADDKGFFQPRKLQRMCGFNEDDFKILIAKGYFITFDSGVMVVTDWNKNNWLDSRRVVETEYVEELNMLKMINDKYELTIEKDIAKQMLSQNSIEENSIEYNIKEKVKRKVFEKPTIEMIQKYCRERNNGINANAFYDFYESKDWMVGKNKMKDWKACIRTWESRSKKESKEIIPSWYKKEFKDEKCSPEELAELEELMKDFK